MTDLVAAGVSLASWPLRGREARSDDERQRRRTAADPLLRALRRITALCMRRESQSKPWARRIRDLYAAIDDAEFTTPSQWNHLRRSVGAALGEATRLAFVDRYPEDADGMFEIEGTWLAFAEDYFSSVTRRVGTWREFHSNRRARRVRIETFDGWLRRTRRYEPLKGTWPDDRARHPQR